MATLTATRKSAATGAGLPGDYYPSAAKYNPPADPVNGDWTAAIQAAADDAYNNGGGRVFLAPGTYHTSSTLFPKTRVKLVGSGQAVTTLLCSNLTGQVVTINQGVWYAQVTDLKVKYTTSAIDRNVYDVAFGVYVSGTQCLVRRVEATDALCGIILNGAQDCLITENHVHDTVADGISLFASTNGPNIGNRVIQNTVERVGDDGTGIVHYLNYTAIPSEGNIIAFNTYRDIQATGIKFYGNRRNQVFGNYINNTFNAGIAVLGWSGIGFGAVGSADVYNNTIIKAGKYPTRRESGNSSVNGPCGGIVLKTYADNDRIKDVVIENNYIYEAAGSYIATMAGGSTATMSNITIRNNQCLDGNVLPVYTAGKDQSGPGHGIWLNNVSSVKVSGNIIVEAFGAGIYGESSVYGVLQVSGNTIYDCNRGGLSGNVAGIVANAAAAFLALDNTISDPNTRLVNAIYYNSSIAEVKCEAANNIVGTRAVATSPAGTGAGGAAPAPPPTTGGGTTTPPAGSDTTGNGGGTAQDPELFKENFAAPAGSDTQGNVTYNGWHIDTVNRSSRRINGKVTTDGQNAVLTPFANTTGEDYIQLTTSNTYNLSGHLLCGKLLSPSADAKLESSVLIGNAEFNLINLSYNAGKFTVEVVTQPGNTGQVYYAYPLGGYASFDATANPWRGLGLLPGVNGAPAQAHVLISPDGEQWSSLGHFDWPLGNTGCYLAFRTGYYNSPTATPSSLVVDVAQNRAFPSVAGIN